VGFDSYLTLSKNTVSGGVIDILNTQPLLEVDMKLNLKLSAKLLTAELPEELEVEDKDQEFSGKGTSLTPKQMRGGRPALFNKITDWPTGGRVFDIGAGRPEMTEALREWFATKNITYLPYDKFNGDTYNDQTMAELRKEKADMAVASNLLNVIPDLENRIIVLKRMWNALKPGGTIHITAHRQSGKTEGPSGKDSWQNHKNPVAYLDEVKSIFPNAIVANDMISATK
jgi:hypothetical protein